MQKIKAFLKRLKRLFHRHNWETVWTSTEVFESLRTSTPATCYLQYCTDPDCHTMRGRVTNGIHTRDCDAYMLQDLYRKEEAKKVGWNYARMVSYLPTSRPTSN